MEQISNDFIFGTLATDRQRLAFFRADSASVSHRHRIDPLDPLPGQAVYVTVTLGPTVVADQVTCYFTTDDTIPGGHLGVPAPGSQSVAFTRVTSVWNTFLWGYLDEWQCRLPAQNEGTTVRYCIEAWSSLTGASTWASEIVGSVADDGRTLDEMSSGWTYLRECGVEFGLILCNRPAPLPIELIASVHRPGCVMRLFIMSLSIVFVRMKVVLLLLRRTAWISMAARCAV